MSMPDVSDAFWDWGQTVTFQVLRTETADFEVVEVPINMISFDGVLEPLKAQELVIKPENQRSWKWWNMWSTFCLNPGQVIQDPFGSQFRVMARSNWTNGGYYQYDLVQDPPVIIPAPVPA